MTLSPSGIPHMAIARGSVDLTKVAREPVSEKCQNKIMNLSYNN